MTDWQELILSGNNGYDQKDWQKAEISYCRAASILERQWQQNQSDARLMMAWIAVYHNLSSLYESLGSDRQALRYLMLPYRKVMKLLQHTPTDHEFRFSLIRAARTTITPILSFSGRHPICDCCKAGLEKSLHQIQNTHPTIH